MQQLKQRIARQFSRAASAYDTLADIQAEIAFDALMSLPPSSGVLIDLGCGTGRYVKQLETRADKLIGIDIAHGMLSHARQRFDSPVWLCADAESLPLAEASVDRVFSSMALQWCSSATQVMKECVRVMRKGAQGTLAIMCDGSFPELSQCWMDVDNQRKVNRLFASQDWQSAAEQAGLKASVTLKHYTSWHNDLKALLNSIRQIGANTTTHTTHRPLTRASLRELECVYGKRFGQQGKLPLTYTIVLLQVTKPND